MNNSSDSVNMTQASLQCPSTNEPVAITWIKILLYLLLVILTFFGDALVIWIVYKYKQMHTAPNFLIVNMAVSCTFSAWKFWIELIIRKKNIGNFQGCVD